MKLLVIQFSPLPYFLQPKFLGALFSYCLLEQKVIILCHFCIRSIMYCKLKMKSISVDVAIFLLNTVFTQI